MARESQPIVIENNKVAKAWRTIAIILAILFLAETIFLVLAYNVGVSSQYGEIECANNVCSSMGFNSYQFDSVNKMCYCYNDGELKYSKFIR